MQWLSSASGVWRIANTIRRGQECRQNIYFWLLISVLVTQRRTIWKVSMSVHSECAGYPDAAVGNKSERCRRKLEMILRQAGPENCSTLYSLEEVFVGQPG